jgi:hypothetical protein
MTDMPNKRRAFVECRVEIRLYFLWGGILKVGFLFKKVRKFNIKNKVSYAQMSTHDAGCCDIIAGCPQFCLHR